MGYTNPAITDFKAYFVRDWAYSTDPAVGLMDSDITSGLNDAAVNINVALWPTQLAYTNAYLLLAAHYVVMNIRASSQGISGQFGWLEASKSVGAVSEGFSIPQRILDNPYFSYLSKTNYGIKYLMFALPQLSGNVYTVCGGTNR